MHNYYPKNVDYYPTEASCFPEEYDYLGNSASTTDCTGLIPAGTVNGVDLINYQDLVHFGGLRMPPRDLYFAGYPQSPK